MRMERVSNHHVITSLGNAGIKARQDSPFFHFHTGWRPDQLSVCLRVGSQYLTRDRVSSWFFRMPGYATLLEAINKIVILTSCLAILVSTHSTETLQRVAINGCKETQ